MRLGCAVGCRACRRFALASDGARRTGLPGLLILVALAVGIFVWRSGNVTQGEATAPVVAPPTRAQSTTSAVDKSGVAIPLVTAARHELNFDSITSISQLQNEATTSDQPGQALEYLRVAATYCEYRALDARYKTHREKTGQMSPSELRSLAYQRAFGKRFCNVRFEDSGTLAEKFMSLDSDDDLLQALFLGSLDDAEAATAGVAVANQLIRESSAPDAIARSAQFLLLRGESLPQAQGIPAPPGMDNLQVRFDAQMLAISMLGCEMRGGCGPGGFHTALNCARRCGPTVSLNDVWRQSFSPQTLAYARALAAAIKADRAGARP